jgi:hypothetical protein
MVLAAVVAVGAAAVASGLATSAAAARPHIIMMLADDWGSYDASFRMKELGRVPDINTPNIDELSATGLRFANCASHLFRCCRCVRPATIFLLYLLAAFGIHVALTGCARWSQTTSSRSARRPAPC